MTTIQVIRRDKAKGTDICRQGNYLYIIRSDLGIFVKVLHERDDNDPVTIKIYPLHPNCAWGDHYCAVQNPENRDGTRFYIIKGDRCRIVTDLINDADPAEFRLSENCRGGDFYMARTSQSFIIIKASDNKYLYVTDMRRGRTQVGGPVDLCFECRGGQYYWATENHLYFLTSSILSFKYHRTVSLYRNSNPGDFPVYPPVATLLTVTSSTTNPVQVIRRDKAKGTDICGQGNYLYIIRSDLGIFVKAPHERDDSDPVMIYPLHPNCAWGDHYCAVPINPDDPNSTPRFYIIKGDRCRTVTNLTEDAEHAEFRLNENCRGGVFYTAKTSQHFFIIKQSGNQYLHVTDMENDAQVGGAVDLCFECRAGQYYWATKNHFYFLRPSTFKYHRTESLDSNTNGADFPVYSPVATFLPVTSSPTNPIQIVPRKKAKGTDFCGQSSYQYIIRSDLGCYMKAYHVRDGDDPVTIHPLHPTCAWGDHYMATPKHFYIIKGNECRSVTDLCTGANLTTITLHPDFKGGAFYMANSKNFFVIKMKAEPPFFECKCGENLENASNDRNQTISDTYLPTREDINDMRGWYYWATNGYFYFQKPVNDWSLAYHRIPDQDKWYRGKDVDFPVYPPITAFLPGGLAVIMGPTFNRWERLLSIPGSNVGEKVDLTIKRKQGYKKPIVNPVQHEWNMSQRERSAGLTTEEIFKAALKRTFYFPPKYGGLGVDATKEDWSDIMEVEESLSVFIPSQQLVYVWQYVLGIGDQVVLYTKHIRKTKNDFEPQNVTAPDTAPQTADERREQMLVPLPRTQFSEEQNSFVTMLQHKSNKPSNFD